DPTSTCPTRSNRPGGRCASVSAGRPGAGELMRLPAQGPARVWSAWLAILAVAAVPSVCSAQAAAASKLKAAFTLNFVKFTEWPDLKPGQPILVCVASDESIADAMTQVMIGQ